MGGDEGKDCGRTSWLVVRHFGFVVGVVVLG
jgi:hypothetical protein